VCAGRVVWRDTDVGDPTGKPIDPLAVLPMSTSHHWELGSTSLEMVHTFFLKDDEDGAFCAIQVPCSCICQLSAALTGNVSTYLWKTWRGSLGQKRCSTAFYSFTDEWDACVLSVP